MKTTEEHYQIFKTSVVLRWARRYGQLDGNYWLCKHGCAPIPATVDELFVHLGRHYDRMFVRTDERDCKLKIHYLRALTRRVKT